MKKTFTLLKVAVLLILLVFNKQAKDKKLALSTEVKQKITATFAMQQQPATAGVFLPFVNSGVISLAE